VFSFILITEGIFSCGKRGGFIICIMWLMINSAFELGQKYKTISVSLVPGWFEKFPILEKCKNYFAYGTFDVLDLASIVLGALLGYIVILISMKLSAEYEKR